MVVSFEGDTTVGIAYRLKSALLQVLQEPVEHYRIDLAQVTDTDITFVQLLISFGKPLSAGEADEPCNKLPGGFTDL